MFASLKPIRRHHVSISGCVGGSSCEEKVLRVRTYRWSRVPVMEERCLERLRKEISRPPLECRVRDPQDQCKGSPRQGGSGEPLQSVCTINRRTDHCPCICCTLGVYAH